jgi:two-component system, chemotaxis family, protein-glutamate methylesterase/glutaminase
MNPLRALIVDDSRIFRHAIEQALGGIESIQVVGSVFSGEKALEFLKTNDADFITLDIQMPGMGGMATLRQICELNAKRPPNKAIDVIVVSSLTAAGATLTIEALETGALDVVQKPASTNADDNTRELQNLLSEKVELVRSRRKQLGTSHEDVTSKPAPMQTSQTTKSTPFDVKSRPVDAIVIGVSTGGPQVLQTLLPDLMQQTDRPILIVQHILRGLSGYFAESLSRKMPRPIIEVTQPTIIQQSGVYLARSGFHMVVRRDQLTPTLVLTNNPPENNCRPSVDVLFRSAAAVYSSSLIGCILTGMGNDGAAGVRTIKRAGGITIAQDKDTSIVWGMPRAAVETGDIHHVVSIQKMADLILSHIARPILSA